MRRFLKVLFMWGIIILCLPLILAGMLFIDRNLAEHRANALCDAAMQQSNADEIQALINDTRGAGFSVFLGQSITVQFDLLTGERYVCMITLDDQGKPAEKEIVYKDL